MPVSTFLTRCLRRSTPATKFEVDVPRIESVKAPIDKIGAIIGPGGKNIRALQEETNTKIDIDDDGTVFIASTDGVGFEEARDRILSLTETLRSVVFTPVSVCA